MKRTLFRILLLVGALAYVAAVSVSLVGAWFLHLPTVASLSRGLRWTPGNPLLWREYAGYWLYASGGSESNRAADAFLRAATLNPTDPANWDGLTTAYLQLWEPRKAEAALRAELAAVPHSPQAAWRLGNFLLVEGRPDEAFPYLKAAAGADRSLDLPVYDLAWKILTDPEVILRDLVPSGPEAREDYLSFLVQRRKLPEANEVWQEVRSNHRRNALNLGYFFVDGLVAAGMGTEAAQVWEELLADTGRARAKPAGELLTNGDFEAGLPNAGLDWRLDPKPGYQIALDDFVAQNGAHSLQVTFDGTSNPDFYGVWQRVPVEPNHEYHFRGYLKTQNITTDNGLCFFVVPLGVGPGENFVSQTETRVGTNPWTLEQLDFRTGPKTRIIQVTLRRFRSSKLNNLIQGKVWIDNLSLRTRAE